MLFEDTYSTIKEKSEGIFKDRGSKFIALAYPVITENEAKVILSEIRKQYHDACHHCYAYRIGSDKMLYRSSDDGEPSGTAGKPIFNQILSKDLTNIFIVVVRYFGGTLLGVPGLITKTINEIYEVNYDYPVMNDVMKIIKDNAIDIISTDFNLKCKIVFKVRKNNSLFIYESLKKIDSLEIKYLKTE